MTRPFLILSLVLSTVAGPATAQAAWPQDMQPEGAVARLVEAAMPNSEYRWSLGWSPFGSRLSHAGAQWALSGPNPYERTPLPTGMHRRAGWATVNGRTVGISVYGDEEVITELSLEVGDLWLGRADVLEELQTLGVLAAALAVPAETPLSPDQESRADAHYQSIAGRYPAHQAWRLEKPGHDPARLDIRWVCTPPGTRHATHCERIWTVRFDAN